MATQARAPLFVDDTPRRPPRHHEVLLHRPPPGALAPMAPMPFRTLDPYEPVLRQLPTDESMAVVFYQPVDNVTVTLAGQSAAFAVGSFAPSNDQGLPGVSATFAVGSPLNETTLVLLSGVSATFAVGSPSSVFALTLNGQEVVSNAGVVAAQVGGDLSLTLVGFRVLTSAGTLTPEGALGLPGVAARFASGVLSAQTAESLSLQLTGVQAAFSAGSVSPAAWFNVRGAGATFYAGKLGLESYFGWATVVALSQTGIQGSESIYPEGTFCFVVASYYDLMGNPFVPQAVEYRIDDVLSGTNILPWTALVPSTANQVTITAAQNTMISLTRATEQHQVLFQITDYYGEVAYAYVVFDVARMAGG